MKKQKPDMQFLTSSDLEQQEHLSSEYLMKFSKNDTLGADVYLDKPTTNYIDLMNWVVDDFGSSLTDQNNLNKFVHNKIVIDGQFLQYCKEKNISVECLYKESATSWKTEHNFEKFLLQGVFLIKNKEVEFLHAGLFHKGNQMEDEISFMIICSDKNYNAYIALRNDFDSWVQKRDRSNLHIRVVGGNDLSYEKDTVWDDLFLPKSIKTDIKSAVESFLASKDFYLKNKMPWKMGLLLFGEVGLGKTTIIKTLISCYDFKPVTIAAGSDTSAVYEAFAYAESQSPALLFFEDLDSMLDKNIDTSAFLNLMDGIAAKNGILVVATANEIRALKSSITDRPSRFDRKYEIPLPTIDMAELYLKKWFGALISAKKIKELAIKAELHGFSYAYLKELYISSMFGALSRNRKSPNEKDINAALTRLIKDKHLLNGGSVNLEKYTEA